MENNIIHKIGRRKTSVARIIAKALNCKNEISYRESSCVRWPCIWSSRQQEAKVSHWHQNQSTEGRHQPDRLPVPAAEIRVEALADPGSRRHRCQHRCQ